jgi:acetyl-CoA C-acetyltransferase
LNRFCGSGVQAVNFAAMGVLAGAQEVVVAGGVESMSRVPMGSDGGGQDGGNATLRRRFTQVPQGISADLIATLEGISRAEVDQLAVRSQERAAAAVAAGAFGRSVVPIVDPEDPGGSVILLARDEYPRAGTTLAALGALEPSFAALGASPIGPGGRTYDQAALAGVPAAGARGLTAIEHVHTAGNSSGIVDGAAAVLLASDGFVEAHGLRPRARIRAMATIGSDPVLMLTGPAPASERALRHAGMTAKDVDLWEINEAFAAVVIQTTRALGIDPDRVNVSGGAIALGHPLGATGAMLLGTLVDELERRNLGTGVVTMCIGGGQGIATVVERV